jgi:hypothetical protein
LPLIDYVEGDSLLHSLVTMYCVRDTNNIIIVPNISGHVVNIGNTSGLDNKFAKLKLFYSEVLPKRGWNTYDTISVKWNHQIVATRRVKAVQQTVEYDPEDDEQAPDIETMTTGTAAEANVIKEQPSKPKEEAKPEEKKEAKSDGKKEAAPDNKKSN